ncbi:hypothetical protein PsYK624_114280 [Phanerochaete sordida]|uniref:Uncharacterized protein n=1 Tax=Phanerochaete sordida TaxID=48140 RepID=A0A9P3LH74_9APHY|nr:hypothetical protein PsYK624_114280 [Phanerochaete sordida]
MARPLKSLLSRLRSATPLRRLSSSRLSPEPEAASPVVPLAGIPEPKALPYTNYNAFPESMQNPPEQLSDVRAVRRALLHFVPLELADMILHEAHYYVRIAAHTLAPIASADPMKTVLAVYLDEQQAACAVAMLFSVRGRPGRVGHEIRTWFSLSLERDIRTRKYYLGKKGHISRRTGMTGGTVEWSVDASTARQLREEGKVEMRAHAVSGEVNQIAQAVFSVDCFPSGI